MINGRPQYAGVCFKCNGAGKVWGKWIERTPEYQAKLDAKREAKAKARQAEQEAKRAEQEKARLEAEAKWQAEQERIKAEKALSNYVGDVKQRLTMKVTYIGSASFEVKSFAGYGTEEMYVHMFKDEAGDKLVWKTGSPLDRNIINEGDLVELTGTVKEHKEYKDEKQTVLTRCKVKAVA